jgi:precorrin-6B methylase 2
MRKLKRLIKIFYHYLAQAGELFLRWRYGLDTSGFVYLDKFGLQSPERIWYDPSNMFGIQRALRTLDIKKTDVFIDFGSGKGGAVFIAALKFPFKKVLGVELSEEFNHIARSNIEKNRRHLSCKNVAFITSDILEFKIPDEVTVAYFYCPIIGKSFKKMIDRLIESVDQSPRLLRLVYNFPFEHDLLLKNERIQILDVIPSQLFSRDRSSPHVTIIYLVMPIMPLPEVSTLLLERSAKLKDAQEWLSPYDPGFVIRGPGQIIKKSNHPD